MNSLEGLPNYDYSKYGFEVEVYSQRITINIYKSHKGSMNNAVIFKTMKEFIKSNYKIYDDDIKELSAYYQITLFYDARDDFLENIDKLNVYLDNGFQEDKEKYKQKIIKFDNKGSENKFLISEAEIFKHKKNVLAIFGDKEKKDQARSDASEYIVDILKNKTKFYSMRNDDKEEIWVYDNGIYIPNGVAFIQEFTRLIMGNMYTSSFSNLIKDKIRSDSFIDESEFFDSDNNKYDIVVDNGILNIKTRTLTAYTQDKIFLNKFKINYDPSKKCNKIISFIKDIISDERDLVTIQQLFGYLLLREYKYERCFMLIGGGRNGKSKFADLIKLFINPESCCNLQPSIFEDVTNFSISSLYGKLANIAVDINSTSLKNTGVIKSLSGRDLVTFPRKFKTPITFVNYAKLIFGANELPITFDTKDAFWERWIIFEFPFTFKTETDYYKVPENERENFKIRDTEIISKITEKEQMQGLLNWALDGLDSLETKGEFTYRLAPQEVRSLWVRKSDSFSAFFMDCVNEDYDFKVSKNDLKKAYSDFCKQNKLKPLSERYIKRFLDNEGISDYQDSHGTRMWKGLRFKDNYERVEVEDDHSHYNGSIKNE